jgi:hypothetical protein
MSELTIAAGAITPTSGLHSVDTELDAASDDLDAIDQTNLPDGSLLFIRNDTDGRAVVVKHGIVGAGQILLADGQDLTLDGTAKGLWLRREGTTWAEVARLLGAASFAAKQATVESFTDATVRALTRDDDGKLFLLDASTAAFTVPLPAVAAVPNGTEYSFRMIGGGGLDGSGNRVTIDGSGAEIVELDATYELLVVDHEVAFRSNGTKWVRLYENRPRIREIFSNPTGNPHTWNRPGGIRYAKIWIQGGGGSGSRDNTFNPSGGGAGGTVTGTYDVSQDASFTINVGVGGAAQAGGAANGNAGSLSDMSGTTSGTLGTGNGGAGGIISGLGGVGGTATGGDLNIQGGDGMTVSSLVLAGNGGPSHFAGGGRGGSGGTAGGAGRGPGAGGGASNGTQISGAGADGVVIVEY